MGTKQLPVPVCWIGGNDLNVATGDGVFTPDDVDDLIAVLEPFIRQEAQHGR